MQNALCVCGLIAFALVYVFLPETSHPGARGLERARKRAEAEGPAASALAGAKRWYWLNPFKSLMLLRSPNLLAIVHPPQVTAFHLVRLLTSDQAPTPAPKRNVNSLSTTSSRVADLVPATKITAL